MSLSVSSRRACLGAVVLGLLVAGCPTGGDPGSGPDNDGGIGEGGPVGTDGGPATDTGTNDAATDGDGASLPPPCSRLTTPLCKDGEKCAGAPDCVSKVCLAGLCAPAAPADGVKNGDETDVDCGGSKAPACADGKGCLVKSDCVSGVCTGMICQAPTSTDGVQNGDETGVDCGGTTTNAPRCPTGGGCLSDADCDKAKCDLVAKKCLAPTHSDGIKNLDETGIDCGGPTAAVARCAPGQGCAADSDCANTRCNPGTLVCDPATSTDGLKNGTETDVDCGGGPPTNAPGCAAGLNCGVDNDCASTACNYANKCVEAKSCKVQHGGDTCGPTGTSSCCENASTGVVTLDKYNITAGRMRAFVTATGGNLRGYIQANTPVWWNAAWTTFLPNVLDNGGSSPDDAPAFSGVYQELGPYTHGTFGPANEGCYIAGSGARTYWLPAAVAARMGDTQKYTQAALDDRSLNCVTAYMVAAFCAWDGGRPPTRAEVDSAWAGYYPWGANTAANRPLGYAGDNTTNPNGTQMGDYNPYQAATPLALVNPPLPASNLLWANYNDNYWGGATYVSPDKSVFIAPPGRFPNGNGPFGHADLGGNVFNTLIETTGGDFYWSRSGSWQGHPIPWAATASHFPGQNKYWATGGRCAR